MCLYFFEGTQVEKQYRYDNIELLYWSCVFWGDWEREVAHKALVTVNAFSNSRVTETWRKNYGYTLNH